MLERIIKYILSKLSQQTKADIYQQLRTAETNRIYQDFRKRYAIHPNFKFNGKGINFYGKGQIICGENSYIGNLSTIQAADEYIVNIGNKCSISHNVRIYTTSAIPDQDFTINKQLIKGGDVIIEDGVWIGANVFINPGITIGRNSVVGANSVVTKNIEPDSIYGGVPSKLIRKKKL